MCVYCSINWICRTLNHRSGNLTTKAGSWICFTLKKSRESYQPTFKILLNGLSDLFYVFFDTFNQFADAYRFR